MARRHFNTCAHTQYCAQAALWLEGVDRAAAVYEMKKFLELDPHNPSIRSAIYTMGMIYERYVQY